MIAALYVNSNGAYSNLVDVDPWPKERDARNYQGPWPIVAHPDCKRWGRFWHGSPLKPHQFKKGDDGGCFAAALRAVRFWGGVIEHPCDSRAWDWFGIPAPIRGEGWLPCNDPWNGHTCYVEQGWYGHGARKGTWLYAVGTELPQLDWRIGEQRLDPVILARHGYSYARRQGLVSMVGGKAKTDIRNATPLVFRDLLLDLARTVYTREQESLDLMAKKAAAPVKTHLDYIKRVDVGGSTLDDLLQDVDRMGWRVASLFQLNDPAFWRCSLQHTTKTPGGNFVILSEYADGWTAPEAVLAATWNAQQERNRHVRGVRSLEHLAQLGDNMHLHSSEMLSPIPTDLRRSNMEAREALSAALLAWA